MTVQSTTKNAVLQSLMVLEGTRSVTSFSVAFTGRWLSIGRGYSPADVVHQFINIVPPAVGTVIPKSTGATVTVTATGVALAAWETLWWIQDVNGNANQGSYYVTVYNDNVVLGENAVWIAKRVGNSYVMWADYERSDQVFAPALDFWRNAVSGAADANTNLPDGTADWSQDIQRRGKLGVGFVQAQAPVAMLDVANGGRSGTDRRNAGDPLYATAALGAGPDARAAPSTAWFTGVKAGILHSNQTAGWVLGWNAIYQVGATTHDFVLGMAGTSAEFAVQWAGVPVGGNTNSWWNRSTTPNNNVGWQHLFSVGGTIQANYAVFRSPIGNGNGYRHLWQGRTHTGAYSDRMQSTPSPVTQAARLDVNPLNIVEDALLVLWGDPATANGQFSIGIRGGTQAYFTGGVSTRFHRFYSTQAKAVNQSHLMLWEDAAGQARVRFELPLPTSPAGLAAGDLWRNGSVIQVV